VTRAVRAPPSPPSRNARSWSKGAFEDAPEGAEGAPRVALSAHAKQREALDANTLRHAAGLPALHAVGACGRRGLRARGGAPGPRRAARPLGVGRTWSHACSRRQGSGPPRDPSAAATAALTWPPRPPPRLHSVPACSVRPARQRQELDAVGGNPGGGQEARCAHAGRAARGPPATPKSPRLARAPSLPARAPLRATLLAAAPPASDALVVCALPAAEASDVLPLCAIRLLRATPRRPDNALYTITRCPRPRPPGIRVVDVPASELGNLLDIARGCARSARGSSGARPRVAARPKTLQPPISNNPKTPTL
jgi:hypothetical protein